MTDAKRALVLLGYSGTGKDTLVRMAQAAYDGIGNCKFGEFNKRIVAELLGVPLSYMEDKQWRERYDILKQHFGVDTSYHMSPFDLLSTLFVGGTSYTPAGEHHRSCYQSYTIAKAHEHKLPIFTDIRHYSELMKVKGNFHTCVVYIDAHWIKPAANDGNVRELAKLPKVKHLVRMPHDLPSATFDRLLEITNNYWND